jgi:hypothetical protein
MVVGLVLLQEAITHFNLKSSNETIKQFANTTIQL